VRATITSALRQHGDSREGQDRESRGAGWCLALTDSKAKDDSGGEGFSTSKPEEVERERE